MMVVAENLRHIGRPKKWSSKKLVEASLKSVARIKVKKIKIDSRKLDFMLSLFSHTVETI